MTLWSGLAPLLTRAGQMPSAAEREAFQSAGSVNDLATLFRRRGFLARPLTVELDDLTRLPPPVVLDTSEGPAVLQARRWGRVVLCGRTGRRTVNRAALGRLFSGRVLDLVTPAPATDRPLVHLLSALAARPAWLGALGAVTVLAGLLSVLPALLLRAAIDVALPEGSVQLLAVVAVLALACALHQALLIAVRGRLVIALTAQTSASVRHWMLSHVLRLPFIIRNRGNYGRAAQRLSQSERFSRAFTQQLSGGVVDGISALVVAPAMLALSPAVGALILVPSLALLATSFLIGAAQARKQGSGEVLQAIANQSLSELVHGAEDLKANGAELWWAERWKEQHHQERQERLSRERLALVAEGCRQTFRELCWLATLLVGASQILGGRASTGDLLGLLALSTELSRAVSSLAGAATGWASLRHLGLQVRTTLAEPAESATVPALMRPRSPDALVVEGLWFRYDESSPWVVRDLSFTLRRHQRLIVRGRSGVGKTTILRMLAGVLAPSRGSVLVHGWEVGRARQLITYFPQDAPLWGASLRENLAVYSAGAPQERILATAARTGLAEWMKTLPLGYDTRVVSQTNLSGGERQLLMLTACLASDAPIILLDEPFAHMDVTTQARLASSGLLEGRTVVLVGHDQATAALGAGAVIIDPWNSDDLVVPLAQERSPC
jgi:ABC-type bacteriocin/lantibiotic exporter with double-glycine peptidase domain